MKSKQISCFLLIFTAMIILSKQQPTNFDYKQHGKDWSGDCIPQKGIKQSPIVLSKTGLTSNKTSYLFADFRSISASATIYNTTLYVKPASSDLFFGQIYTKIIDQRPVPFKAFEIRIRTRSQHRIGDENGYYDLEIQISFKQLYDSSKNIKLNVGILFQAKQDYEEDPFLTEIISKAKDINQTFTIKANLDHLLSRQKLFDFWFYLGSTTFPSCADGKLNWIIPQKIFKMKSSQLDFFKKLYPDGNWRDIQPIKNNQIGYALTTPSLE